MPSGLGSDRGKVRSLQAFDVWTVVAALATAFAALVALGVAVIPLLWRRWWKGPRLDICLGDAEPWERVTKSVGQADTQAWLRIEVVNKGRAEARNVRAVVHEWYERSDETAQWLKHDIDPSALHWVSMPQAWQVDSGARRDPAVSVPQGLSDFADLVRYTPSTNEHMLILDDQRPRGFRFKPMNAFGEFIVSVTVLAENADALTKHVHYSLSGEFFTDVRFVDSTPADYRFLGLLSDIRRGRRGEKP